MDRLSKLLPAVLNKRGLLSQSRASHAVHRANEWLVATLPQFEGMVRAVRLQNGELFLDADHPIVLQECTLLLGNLLSHLEDEGFTEVREVRILRSRGNA